MKQNEYPPGWDEERVQKVIEYYENQTEDEAVAEDEAAFRHELTTNVEVPSQLVPFVNKLISNHVVDDQEQQIGTKNQSHRFSVDPSTFSDTKESVSWSGKPADSCAFYGLINLRKQNLEMQIHSHD